MNNPSFEIYVNNQLVSIAGITAEFGVVTAMTTWVTMLESKINYFHRLKEELKDYV